MGDLPRVFFDSNGGSEESGYWLTYDNSKADLARLEAGPLPGQHVLLYMPGELEVEAHLRWDSTINHWVAMPVSGTWTPLDRSEVSIG